MKQNESYYIPLHASPSNELFPIQRIQLGTNFKEDFGT